MTATTPLPHEGMSIRVAVAADYEAVLDLWNDTGLHPRISGRDCRAAFEHQLTQFPGLYLVAQDKDRLIGVVIGTHDHRKGWINRLAVLPQYRRRGIGRMLAQACDAAIRAGGIQIVAALVEEGNGASMSLFRDLGYKTDAPVAYFRKLDHPDA